MSFSRPTPSSFSASIGAIRAIAAVAMLLVPAGMVGCDSPTESSDPEGPSGGKADDLGSVQELREGALAAPWEAVVPNAARFDGKIMTLLFDCDFHQYAVFWDGNVQVDGKDAVVRLEPGIQRDPTNGCGGVPISTEIQFDMESAIDKALAQGGVERVRFTLGEGTSVPFCEGGCAEIGDTCDTAIVLRPGKSVVSWAGKEMNDFDLQGVAGTDVVMSYTADSSGVLRFQADLSATNALAVTDGPCGDTASLVFEAFASDGPVSGSLWMEAGTTYHFYAGSEHPLGEKLKADIELVLEEHPEPACTSALLGDSVVKLEREFEWIEGSLAVDADPSGWVYGSTRSTASDPLIVRINKETRESQPVAVGQSDGAGAFTFEGFQPAGIRTLVVNDDVYLLTDREQDGTALRRIVVDGTPIPFEGQLTDVEACSSLAGGNGRVTAATSNGKVVYVVIDNRIMQMPLCDAPGDVTEVAELPPNPQPDNQYFTPYQSITADENAFYVSGGSDPSFPSEKLLRVDRQTNAVETIATGIATAGSQLNIQQIAGHDIDGDGGFDVFYLAPGNLICPELTEGDDALLPTPTPLPIRMRDELGSKGVQAIALDETNGTLWGIAADALYRLE